MAKEEKVWVGIQGIGSACIPGFNHLLTHMWRHASAEGLGVYSFWTSIPHYPVAQVTSHFHNR